MLSALPKRCSQGNAENCAIVVGVALETMKQIEAYVLMRHYEGFMK